jgi:hypothetical protein
MATKLKVVADNSALSAREALADAIERHRAAVAAKAANADARDTLERKIWQLSEIVERGHTEIEEAKQALLEHEMRKAYGADEPAPPSLKEVRVAVQDREDELSRLRTARDSMAAAAKDIDTQIQTAGWRLSERINDVVRDDANVGRLLAKFQQAAADAIVLRQIWPSCRETRCRGIGIESTTNGIAAAMSRPLSGTRPSSPFRPTPTRRFRRFSNMAVRSTLEGDVRVDFSAEELSAALIRAAEAVLRDGRIENARVWLLTTQGERYSVPLGIKSARVVIPGRHMEVA